ncbi:uncharacterized protein DUF1707 [Herbihabitans rhizosphaerae]|uniref:Uncharacterized protein DUF1707 n=1 Tax=Herbihabitans rhizosphaerae TaxID=1872711 RepID=A0A4Q7KLW5_9PSEU|nr:DUF1707 domain-containing protein [Herbihabitans rhizosphaerae]RZS37658.1 uncharacterized protein DUF1707 [Herbihabitans rhizosphaerae]
MNEAAPQPVDPKDMRVSDAEREHVVSLLQKAIGQGTLTLDEFTERTDKALAARTRAELNAVLVDLPGVVHRDTAPAVPRRESLELRNTMSKIQRVGRWYVPRELTVRNKMGSTELDFTEAEIEHDQVHIDLDVAAGSVIMLMPPNCSIDANDVEVTAGKIEDKVGFREGARPHFVLTGDVRAGTVKIRRPSYIRIGPMLIRFPWKITWDRR